MKELHLQIGSKENFEKALEGLGVEKKPESNLYTSLYGLKVIENINIPQEEARLIDENGNILQVFSVKVHSKPL